MNLKSFQSKLQIATSILAIAFLFAPLYSNAHQTGTSWEKIVGDYKVDIGYDPIAILSGQPQRIDFNIIDVKSGQTAPFTDIWVRVSQNQDTVFASGIHKLDFGLTGMIFEFPKAGDFNLSVRFENNDNTVAQADIPITVLEGSAQNSSAPPAKPAYALFAVFAVGGLILGATTTFFIKRK